MQEVASSQNSVLMCIQQTISWDILPEVISKLQGTSFTIDHMETGRTRHSLQNVLAIENARRRVDGTFPLSLFEIMLANRFNDCTDPRDKVFAVLGLAKDWLQEGGLDPDYRRTTSTSGVFKRFAMWDI